MPNNEAPFDLDLDLDLDSYLPLPLPETEDTKLGLLSKVARDSITYKEEPRVITYRQKDGTFSTQIVPVKVYNRQAKD